MHWCGFEALGRPTITRCDMSVVHSAPLHYGSTSRDASEAGQTRSRPARLPRLLQPLDEILTLDRELALLGRRTPNGPRQFPRKTHSLRYHRPRLLTAWTTLSGHESLGKAPTTAGSQPAPWMGYRLQNVSKTPAESRGFRGLARTDRER